MMAQSAATLGESAGVAPREHSPNTKLSSAGTPVAPTPVAAGKKMGPPVPRKAKRSLMPPVSNPSSLVRTVGPSPSGAVLVDTIPLPQQERGETIALPPPPSALPSAAVVTTASSQVPRSSLMLQGDAPAVGDGNPSSLPSSLNKKLFGTQPSAAAAGVFGLGRRGLGSRGMTSSSVVDDGDEDDEDDDTPTVFVSAPPEVPYRYRLDAATATVDARDGGGRRGNWEDISSVLPPQNYIPYELQTVDHFRAFGQVNAVKVSPRREQQQRSIARPLEGGGDEHHVEPQNFSAPGRDEDERVAELLAEGHYREALVLGTLLERERRAAGEQRGVAAGSLSIDDSRRKHLEEREERGRRSTSSMMHQDAGGDDDDDAVRRSTTARMSEAGDEAGDGNRMRGRRLPSLPSESEASAAAQLHRMIDDL